MTVVALTGGIASGKSTVAEMFRELGATCIDADDVSREVVEPGTPALREIVAAFGPDVLSEGRLDRAALGALIFADHAKREVLNGIVHPRVRERTAQLIDETQIAHPDAVIVYSIPLLVEAGSGRTFDKVIAVSAEAQTRVQRLIASRGMSETDARARVAAQADESERLAIADFVIDTNDSLEHTRAQVNEIWGELTSA